MERNWDWTGVNIIMLLWMEAKKVEEEPSGKEGRRGMVERGRKAGGGLATSIGPPT